MNEIQAIPAFRAAVPRASPASQPGRAPGLAPATDDSVPAGMRPPSQEEGVVVSLTPLGLRPQGAEQASAEGKTSLTGGAKKAAGQSGDAKKDAGQGGGAKEAVGQGGGAKKAAGPTGGPNDLTPQEKQEVRELQARDQQVHSHEMAHKAVGGRYTGVPHYSYATGPDHRQYAVGGEVSIDVSPVPNDPKATIAKMQVVRSAALAPAQPSGADMGVASAATRIQQEATMELVQERFQEVKGTQKAQEQNVRAGSVGSRLSR